MIDIDSEAIGRKASWSAKFGKCALFPSPSSWMRSPLPPTDSDIDLEALVEFLYDQEARKWIHSTANRFFTTALGNDGIESVVISGEADGAWAVLPESWREYFEGEAFQVGEGEREAVLEDLARSQERVRIRRSSFKGSTERLG